MPNAHHQKSDGNDAFVYWNDDPIVKAELEKYNLKSQMYAFQNLRAAM